MQLMRKFRKLNWLKCALGHTEWFDSQDKCIWITVATGIIAGFVLSGLEVFFLYKEIFVNIPVILAESLRAIVSTL